MVYAGRFYSVADFCLLRLVSDIFWLFVPLLIGELKDGQEMGRERITCGKWLLGRIEPWSFCSEGTAFVHHSASYIFMFNKSRLQSLLCKLNQTPLKNTTTPLFQKQCYLHTQALSKALFMNRSAT